MRYISIDDIEKKLTQNQKEKLLDASKEVKKVFDATKQQLSKQISAQEREKLYQKRAGIIKKYEKCWTDLKNIFENHFYKKCWYTESFNPGFSKEMDHYRPKSSVIEDKKHPGYWWLAFDWKNYRFCCHFSNSLKINDQTQVTGGKGAHFPLLPNSPRAKNPTQDYKDEIPVLLDPCAGGDYKLLSFEINGAPLLHPNFSRDSEATLRVKESIKLLNIDYPDFNEERERIYFEIKNIVDKIERAFIKYKTDKNSNHSWLNIFKDEIAQLEKKISERSPYSRSAEEFVRCFKDRQWINYILQ